METQKTQKFVDANEVVELLKEIDGLKQKIDKLEIEKAELVVAKGKLTYRAETAEGELKNIKQILAEVRSVLV